MSNERYEETHGVPGRVGPARGDSRNRSRSDSGDDSSVPFPALEPWGWDEAWAASWLDMAGLDSTTGSSAASVAQAQLLPGRVVRHVHHSYRLVGAPAGEAFDAEVSGAFAYRTAGPADYPTVGDWVLFERDAGRIQRVLPRKSAVSRSVAGEESLEQVISANIDLLYLVFGLDGGRNFTAGMLERSLLAAWNSGAQPVVVLNKADLADAEQLERAKLEAESNAPGVDVHVVSAVRGDGLDELSAQERPGRTIGMIGKSGVGKSALLNALAGFSAAEGPARIGEQRRGDRQGRHTTSEKQLYPLPSGAILADVPGLRELQLWGDGEELSSAFPEIEALAAECRFSDCAHSGEPGCRVQEALASGELPQERFERYLDYQRELAYLERRRNERAAAEERRKWKKIAQEQRRMKKGR